MPRVFSGIQPTGELHLGNHLGAVRQWVRDQDDHDAVFCVVDLHAMTVPYDRDALADATRRTATLLLAAGLDPERCTLFVQSHVAAHTELTWLLSCVASFGELRRMTQFKDKSGGQESVSVGLFTYPVLMAADILSHDTDRVPVGDDQRQHLELARDIAQRFNNRFGDTFVVPEATVPEVGARVMDLQDPTSKMSKSSESPQGTVLLLDEPSVVGRKFRSAVTDSGREVVYDPENKPGVSNLLEILSVVSDRPVAEIEEEMAGAGYGDLKDAVADAVTGYLAPLRERYAALERDPDAVDEALVLGASKASAVADAVVERARDAAGLLRPAH